MHNKRKNTVLFPVLSLAILLSMTGCSPPRDETKTEAETQSETFIETEPETEFITESETESETEPVTEKSLSLKDVQVSVAKTSRSGTVSYEIASADIISGTFTYQNNGNAFYALADTGQIAYADSDICIYGNTGNWGNGDWEFVDLWNLVYGDCEMGENTDINGTNCYHLSIDYEDSVSPLLGMLASLGYENVMGGTVYVDFYVSSDTFAIVRVDTSMQYLADKDGNSSTGEFTCSFTTDETSETMEITAPETEPETEPDTYKAGTLNTASNLYSNSVFDLQIAGKDIITFNSEKTNELITNYESSGSSYKEEAYAAGDGTILNVSSISAKETTAVDVLTKYLSDSGAEEVYASDDITIGTNVYSTYTSNINQTQTKSYCTICDGRAIIFTLYYNEPGLVDQFEDQLYSTSEDANWTASTWTLSSRYQITTPNGYSIIQSDSSDLYVCMQNSSYQVNIFALTGVTLESEMESETVSSGSVTRETVSSEDVSLEDGSTMKYLVVHNTESTYDYYTYVGLVQTDGTVIKFYVVSTASDADYKTIYAEFWNNITVLEPETETEPVTEMPSETLPE